MVNLPCPAIEFEKLCQNIERRLCELGHLEPNQFPVTQREVVRGGKPIGIYFCVHGPRSVKLTAICDLLKNTIIYYGSDGMRKGRERVLIRNLNLNAA